MLQNKSGVVIVAVDLICSSRLLQLQLLGPPACTLVWRGASSRREKPGAQIKPAGVEYGAAWDTEQALDTKRCRIPRETGVRRGYMDANPI